MNSYDAEAKACRLYIPSANSLQNDPKSVIAIFDDGLGLSDAGMKNLWHVGRSDKRSEEIARRTKRKQIGKFGIGKLAVFVISSQLSYISKSGNKIWFSSLDFNEFQGSTTGGVSNPVKIELRSIATVRELKSLPWLAKVILDSGITDAEINSEHWTLAILEDFKPKAWEIKSGRLKWVLRTAMPLKADFKLFMNKDAVTSSKEDLVLAASFKVTEIGTDRLAALNTKMPGEDWRVIRDSIISTAFPNGIKGDVLVTDKTLPGKSDDILRSNGFFIRVRGRLIAQEEPFFGMNPLYHGVMNRLHADIDADDLDSIIKAPREDVEASEMRDKFEGFLNEVFQEARSQYNAAQKAKEHKEESKKESERTFISSEIIERPIAGAMLRSGQSTGADADRQWFYLSTEPNDWKVVAEELYTAKRRKFTYEYIHLGKTERIIKFHPKDAKFILNADHEFIAANSGDEVSKTLLHDFVLAEVVLEAQLRLASIPASTIGEVLQERDMLLRSLPKDHPTSSSAVAQQLRNSVTNQYDFEIALVAAARALGFVAKHVSGPGEPDGVAVFVEYPRKEIILTIEAKSSTEVPLLPQLDFAGLHSHMRAHKAQGCLLVAPEYPGGSRGEGSQVYQRSAQQKVSCWTSELLAQVVENLEKRYITARQVIDIVLNKFDPADVKEAVEKMLSEPAWNHQTLKSGLLRALESLEARMIDRPRSVDMVATKLSDDPNFATITADDVRKALSSLASVSQGGLALDGDTVILFTSVSEIKRRAQLHLTEMAPPRRASTIRGDLPTEPEIQQ